MRLIDKVIISELRTHSLKLIFVLFIMLLAAGLELLIPWPFKILIDNVLGDVPLSGFFGNALSYLFHTPYALGLFAILLYFLSMLLSSVFEYFRSVMTKKVIENIVAHFSKRAFKSLESLSVGFYNEQQIGDFIYRLSYDVSALGSFLEDGLLPLLTSLLHLLLAIVIMYFIDIKLTFLALISLPVLTLGLYIFNSHIREATVLSEKFNSSTFSFIEEALNHFRIIQGFSQQKREAQRFNQKVDTMVKAEFRLFHLGFLLSFVVGIIVAISYSLVIFFGMSAVFAGTLSTGLLIVFIFYLDNLTNPILSIVSNVASIREAYTKIRRMEDFFTTEKNVEATGTRKMLRGHDIRFESVSTQKNDSKKILKNVSFTLEEGKCTAILGISGSGKTSIMDLIMRFTDKPEKGRVLIGGIDITLFDVDAVRKVISYAPQDISLFDDTVYNNILFGNPKATKKEIKDAVYIADAEDFINRLPGKYQFNVGEGGTFLSGGQKQRLMLVRALLRKHASIFLFDEVFSALDVKTRMVVLGRLQEVFKGKTVILISNVFDVVKQADNVIVLNKGEVIFTGKSSSLPKEVSLYKLLLSK
jgi:ABC-type multidrug transport system fused ATPase/permease subunit